MSRAQKVLLALLLLALAAVGWVIVVLQTGGTTAALPTEVRVIVGSPSVALPYTVALPADVNGCPAATVAAPVEPMASSTAPGTGGAQMFRLGDDAFVLAVCMDMTAADVEKLARGETPKDPSGELADDLMHFVGAERVASAFGDGYAVTRSVGRQLLTDTYVARDGWVFALGYLRPADSGDVHRDQYEAMLAAWRWGAG